MCLVENLKHNLLSNSRLCDQGYKVILDKIKYVIENACDGKILFVGKRCVNVYKWHRRLDHVRMDLISKFSKNDLVKGFPKIGFEKDRICEACQVGKQIKTSFKKKNHVSTAKPL